jgi:hypothetical protein
MAELCFGSSIHGCKGQAAATMETRGGQEFGCLAPFSSLSDSTISRDFFENAGDDTERPNHLVDE